jgi:hypothetical protein
MSYFALWGILQLRWAILILCIATGAMRMAANAAFLIAPGGDEKKPPLR